MMTRYDEVMAAARAELTGLIRQKDPAGIAAIRSVMAELENACAVPLDDAAQAGLGGSSASGQHTTNDREGSALDAPSQHIAGAQPYGHTEVARRVLSDAEVDRIVRSEIAARRDEVATFERLGRDREAAMAGYQAALIERIGGAYVITRGGDDSAGDS